MADFTLDPATNAIVIENGEFPVITGPAAVAQHIRMRLLTGLQESVYDQTVGVPYLQIIFTQRSITAEQIQYILTGIIELVPGVDDVLEIDADFDRPTGQLTVTGRVLVQEEPVDFTVQIQEGVT